MTNTIMCDSKTHVIVLNIGVNIKSICKCIDGVGNTPCANIASKFIMLKDDKDKIR